MDLKAAIQKITDEYVVPEGQTADPGEVAWEVRGAVTSQEIAAWEVDPELAEAYRIVVDASEAEVIRALAL